MLERLVCMYLQLLYIYYSFVCGCLACSLLGREFGFLLFGHYSLSLWVYS
jgi:hypothetical protein